MRVSKENKTEYNKKCGLRLKECREAKGMTQKQVADYFDISQSYISRIEKKILEKMKTAILKLA